MDKNLLALAADIYIERPDTLKDLTARLCRDYFVALLGSSGSGKSMLAKNGLRAMLAKEKPKGRAGDEWRIVSAKPSADPIGNLAAAFAAKGALHLEDELIDVNFEKKIKTKLRTEPDALRLIYNEASSKYKEPFNLLIVIDQLHDLARFKNILYDADHDVLENDDLLYVSLLLDVARSNIPVYIILICDNNYIDHFGRYQGLPEAMSTWRFTIPNISKEDISKTIDPLLNSLDEHSAIMREFTNNLVEAYEKLVQARDQYAMLKFNLSRILTVEKWMEDQTKNPLQIYNSLQVNQGRFQGNIKNDPSEKNALIMKDMVNYFAEAVYTGLETSGKGTVNEDKKRICELVFKGLSSKSGNEQYISEPTRLDQLTGYCSLMKQGVGVNANAVSAPAPNDIKDIVDRFKINGECFIDWIDAIPQPVIDINSGALLHNWERLNIWIEAEITHAEVYRGLVKNGFEYFEQHNSDGQVETLADSSLFEKVTQALASPKSAVKKLLKREAANTDESLYAGSQLQGAKDWKKERQPSDPWAARYPVKRFPDDSNAAERQKNLLGWFTNRPGYKPGNLEVAFKFLALSEANQLAKDAEEKRQLRTAKRWRNISMTLVLVAVIFLIFAKHKQKEAEEYKRNIEMIQFVRMLDENDVLYMPRAIQSDSMLSLANKIKHDVSINNNESVLNLLVQRRILKIDSNDHILKEIDFDALTLLNSYLLHNKKKTGIKTDTSTAQALKDLYDRHTKYAAGPVNEKHFLQNPPLFNTIYAYLDVYFSHNPTIFMSGQDSARLNTIINPNCLTSHKETSNFYVFGDQFGRIWVQDIRKREADEVALLNEAITCVMFSKDGQNLYVGTVSGKAYRYPTAAIFNQTKLTPSKPSPFFVTPNGPIYFMQEHTPGEPLLMWVANELFYLSYDGKPLTKPVDIPLRLVASAQCDPDLQWLIVTGNGKSILYQLDFKKTSFEKKASIAHPNRTVMKAALRPGYGDNDPIFWLAMGSIGGRVWAGKLNVDKLKREGEHNIELDSLDDPIFAHTSWLREGPITGLTFNPYLPQLACSSWEGAIELRNLDSQAFVLALGANEKSLEKDNDVIMVDNRVQGISAIKYLDKNNLAIYQNSTSWVMKTNIDALWKYLNEICKGCK